MTFPRTIRFCVKTILLAAASLGAAHAQPQAASDASSSSAQQAPKASPHKRTETTTLETVTVDAQAWVDGTAAGGYRNKKVDLGPLGHLPIQDTPYSITTVPEGLLVNQQVANISDVIKYDPSTQIEPRGGLDFGRPQSRGFENSVDGNTRIDGLNSYSIMAYPMEAFSGLEILNGAAGALYGASSPGGTFNFVLKRPTAAPFQEYTLGFDSEEAFTEHAEVSDHIDDGVIGYRFNAVHASGESYVKGSNIDRDILSGDFDVHLSENTLLMLDSTYYADDPSGFPDAFVYGTNTANAKLPPPPNPAKYGYGVVGAGQTLNDYNELAQLEHSFNENWSLDLGLMHQYSDRRLNPNGVPADPYGQLLNESGDYAAYVSDSGLQNKVDSNKGYIHGHFDTGFISHNVTIGTNGYQTTSHTRLGQTYLLGDTSLSDPTEYYVPEYTDRGTFYRSAQSGQQSFILGDTMTFDRYWSVLASASEDWLDAKSYSKAGAITSNYSANGVSPTVSVTFKPLDYVMTYVTYADALTQGDTAPLTGVTNPGQELPPYRSQEYEAGAKATVGQIDFATAIFRMKRPYGLTNPVDDTFQVIGEQVNDGVEISARGNVTRDLTLFGGFTWLDPELSGTQNPATNNKLVISVPRHQANLYAEYRFPLAQLHGLAVDGNVHETGNRAGNVTNTTWLGSYTTLDLGLRYSRVGADHRQYTFRLGIDNVFDKRYWAAVLPAAQNGTSANYAAFLGNPRILHASFSLDLF